jgi:glutamate synthase (NADPH/NADH) large chain
VLKALIEEHVAETHSRWGATVLSNWEAKKGMFWQVVPKEMVNRLEHSISDEAAEEKLTA